MESDAVYFVRRAREERDAAHRAEHPAARKAHLDMAERFQELTDAIETHEAELLGRERRFRLIR